MSENIEEIILSVKTGTVDPTAETPDFVGQLYLNTNTDTLFFAKSTTTGDYEEIIDETSTGLGDMTKAEYDIDDNGIVDKSEALNDDSSGGGNNVTASEARGHIDDLNNPHSVDKNDVGLGNVPNLDTTDAVNNEHTHANKTELDLVTDGDHDVRTDNPHGVEADQVPTNESGKTVQDKLDDLDAEKLDDILTSKGELITHDGVSPVIQSPPPDGQILVGDSTETTGYRFEERATGIGLTFEYRAETTDQVAPPSDKRIKWNNATQASATKLFIDVDTDGGANIHNILVNAIKVGERLFLMDRSNSSQFQSFRIDAITDNTTYVEYDVTLISDSDGNFSNNEKIYLMWFGVADAGDMLKSVYDTNNNDIVDKSENLNDGSSGGGNNTSASEVRNHLDNPNAHDASDIDTDTTNFDRILSPSDDTVQKALDTLDNQVADLHDDITIVFQPDQSHNFGDYRVHNISAAGNSNLTFRIPNDFLSLNSITVFFIPINTIGAGQDVDLNSDYASTGEASDTHSESNLAIPITGTANVIESFDISSVFTAISAGDFCGFNWKNNTIGTTISILMIELRYNQIP